MVEVGQESGGDVVARVLVREGVRHVFTLCGGHISPLLVGAKRRGVRVVDVRDERSAVFAADAMARLTGTVGVAAVTAGPGVTNALTAVKNAQLAEVPLVLFGGATATLLRGRGALQDIDQLSLMESATKWVARVNSVPALQSTVERAFAVARGGVPGPVFVEVPVDVLYPEAIVRKWYREESGVERARSWRERALGWALEGYLFRQFHVPAWGARAPRVSSAVRSEGEELSRLASWVGEAKRPVLLLGSQVLSSCRDAERVARAVRSLGVPVWLSGMARGLLGRSSELQFRHGRGAALREADLVVACGVPFDFRLKYGRGIGRETKVVCVHLDPASASRNRRVELALAMHPGEALVRLAELRSERVEVGQWLERLRAREQEREEQIASEVLKEGGVDPILLLQRIEAQLAEDSVVVVDGGDFAATAAYVVRPRGALRWLDPGVFGTLGVGGGFALGAALARPGAEVWVIYGDGSCAFSLAEVDSFVRHGVAPIAVVGNDAGWTQIARDQVTLLGDEVGTKLLRSAYHVAAEGYGAVGLELTEASRIDEVLGEAKRIARQGKPVVLNVHLGKSRFREGAISM